MRWDTAGFLVVLATVPPVSYGFFHHIHTRSTQGRRRRTPIVIVEAHFEEQQDGPRRNLHSERFRNARFNDRKTCHHGYERDTSRDASPVDESAIDMLLSERVEARKRRDFGTADAILDRLEQEFSVRVFDRDKVWKTGFQQNDSNRFGRDLNGGGRNRFADKDRRGGRSSDRGGGRFDNRMNGRFDNRMNDRFDRMNGRFRNSDHFGDRNDSRDSRFAEDRGGGRFGGRRPFLPGMDTNSHDYSLAADAGPSISPLSEAEIKGMLEERLRARILRNFDEADRIQKELIDNGVMVDDANREWRADGRCSHTYTLSPDSQACTNDQFTQIDQLLSKRQAAQNNRQYSVANDIREQLKEQYNVFVSDRTREWSVGNVFFGMSIGDYKMAGTSKANSDAAYIQSQVTLRAKARKLGDFNTADAIQEELLDNFGVLIDDRKGEWSIDEPKVRSDREEEKRAYYARVGLGDLSSEDEAIIVGMVEDRRTAKKNREFALADSIRQELLEKFSVKINDKRREWLVVSDSYRFQGDKSFFDEATFEYIQSQLKERLEYKNNRKYHTSDRIQDELTAKYGIVIDDRDFVWSLARERKLETEPTVRPEESQTNEIQTNADSLQYKFKDDSPLKETMSFLDDLTGDNEVGDFAAEERSVKQGVIDFKTSIIVSDGAARDESAAEKHNGANDDVVESASTDLADKLNFQRTLMEEKLSKMTVLELREKLRKAGLPASGRKTELIEKIMGESPTKEKETMDFLDDLKGVNQNEGLAEKDAVDSTGSITIEVDAVRDGFFMEQHGATKDDNNDFLESTLSVDMGDEPNRKHKQTVEELSKLTVPQLREKLREAGLPVSGRKAELIEKIMDASPTKENIGFLGGLNGDDMAGEVAAKKEYVENGVVDSKRSTRIAVDAAGDELPMEQCNAAIDGNSNFAESSLSVDWGLNLNGKQTPTDEELSKLTVPELREKLKETGLPVSGRKVELIERLLNAYSPLTALTVDDPKRTT